MDRRTERPDGSGGGSPTVVTSRATADDLIGDEQDAQPSGTVAPPRRSPQKPTAAKSAPATPGSPDDAASDGTPSAGPVGNGAPAAGNGIDGAKDASANGGKDAGSNGNPAARDAAFPAAADATIADGVPALPADSIGAARGTKPKGHDPDRETPASKAGEQSGVDDPPAYSFGPPPSAPARPATAAADPAESAVKPSGDDVSVSRAFAHCAFAHCAFAHCAFAHCASGRGTFGYRAFEPGTFWCCACGTPVVERPDGAGRTAVRLRGRVRVGDARPAAQLAVVPGADVPAVGHDGEGPRRAHGRLLRQPRSDQPELG